MLSAHIQEKQIEEKLVECRRLITRSVTDIPRFSTPQKIRKDYPNFIRQCHECNKKVQSTLIQQILSIENEISRLKSQKRDPLVRAQIKRLRYWKLLSGLLFNSLIWIAMGGDRSAVKKIFKGPKFGELKQQNIDSVLSYLDKANENTDEFFIALDFSSFSCICDILKLTYNEDSNSMSLDLIEAKSGKVSDDMLKTIENNEVKSYFDFFDKYGKKGIKQMERFFRQMSYVNKSQQLIDAVPGIYENPEDPDQNLIIATDESVPELYFEEISELLDDAEQEKFAVKLIDDCLIVGIINNKTRNIAILGDFDVRLFIYHIFINPAALEEKKPPKDLIEHLRKIQLTDWRTGFGSVVLYPISIRPISDQYLMDLLFGRKIIMHFFHVPTFIELCRRNGIDMRLTSAKEASHMKLKGCKGLFEYGGRFIRYFHQDIEWTIGEGTLHEMFYNWVRPKSIINSLKSYKIPGA